MVDVTGFNDQTWFDRAGDFHSDALHVVERYTPRSADTISVRGHHRRPKNVFTRPWKISMPLYRHLEKNVQLMEFKCVEFMEELLYGQYRKKPRSKTRSVAMRRSFAIVALALLLPPPWPRRHGQSRGPRRAPPTASRICREPGPTALSRPCSGPPNSPARSSSREAEEAAFEQKVACSKTTSKASRGKRRRPMSAAAPITAPGLTAAATA